MTKTKTKTKMKQKTKKNQSKTKPYDVIILGGGIAGIYTMYRLIQQHPHINILLLEKSERLGGRIHTVKKKGYILEAGAGRFSQKHVLLQELIEEFGLSSKKKEIGSNAEFFPDKTEPELQKYNLKVLILKIIVVSKIHSTEYLQKESILSFAKNILSTDEIDYIKSSFGYYSELIIMNAYDAIELFQQLSPSNQFYILEDGLSQIYEKIIEKIRKKRKNNPFRLHQEVQNILYEKEEATTNTIYSIQTKTNTFYSKYIICALPKDTLERIPIFQPIYSLLHKIKCAPLCRIYSKYDTKQIWFQDLPKITTNNPLRMVIPMDTEKGIIMISYTDNKFADYWNKMFSQNGIAKVNKQLKKYIANTTEISIPEPAETDVFYWKCGVGYWGIGADSREISERIIQPFPNHRIFCCGEHFSEKNQQWIEGALETSNKVLFKLKVEVEFSQSAAKMKVPASISDLLFP